MTAKTVATFSAAFGGACGGVLASGLAQFLCGDCHYLPLIVGTSTGALIAAVSTALVTRNNLNESTPANASNDDANPR
jgi:Patatin-like phospholipase.